MYRWIVLSFIVLNASMFEASKVSENVLKDNKGGDYDVIDVEIGNTDIAIIKKDGVILADEITSKDKEYSIIKYNRTCNVQFYENTASKKEHVIIITTLVDIAERDGGDTHVTSVGTESLDAIDLENRSASSYFSTFVLSQLFLFFSFLYPDSLRHFCMVYYVIYLKVCLSVRLSWLQC
ncbi:uncharacterized protein LOC127727076 isoform X1 [Mytilus californianus]|uniref:uncharacterized protein LOC127727076 isoform X1 n=1 Tax=Mytilus californianus TaxID=6549 RepID=UPI002246DAAA|nr:uncharacterized protein LOC127727076 isoform X1 [Mytilus californianus]